MKVHTTKFSTIIILSLLAFVMTSSVCSAQEYSRSGKSEIFGMFQTMGGGDASKTGLAFDFDDTTVYGFGFGYNIDNHWNLNTDLLFGSTDIDVSGSLATATKGDTDLWLWNVNLDYNFFEDRLTPLVTAGIGVFGMSGDFNNGRSFSESNFSYNLGVGGRWDISDNLFLKAIYRITWHDLEDMDGPDFDGVMFSIGYKW